MRERAEIAVVGAGVVGLCTALRLAQEGREVALIAPADDATGASYGNAGVIADYAVLPIGTPDVLRDLPALLLGRESPLSLRWAALPTLAPWLMRFARQCLPDAARRNARALAALLAGAGADWRALAAQLGGADLLGRRGTVYGYDSAREMARAKSDLRARRDLGVRVEMLAPEELGQMEPGLPRGTAPGGAAFFPDAMSVDDPGAMLALLRAAVAAQPGIRRIEARATGLRRSGAPNGGVEITVSGGAHVRAARAVIAAGAWSRPLARAAGARVPLDTERGYHLEFDMRTPPLTRHFTPVRRGFYFCPLAGRLRVAGTVELGGLDGVATPRRLRALEAGARSLMPDLPAPDRSWMGFRPSLPDSVPVIGPAGAGDDILMAFGHGHLGLTLAPTTARIIAAIAAGRTPPVDIAPYSPGRFGWLPV